MAKHESQKFTERQIRLFKQRRDIKYMYLLCCFAFPQLSQLSDILHKNKSFRFFLNLLTVDQ